MEKLKKALPFALVVVLILGFIWYENRFTLFTSGTKITVPAGQVEYAFNMHMYEYLEFIRTAGGEGVTKSVQQSDDSAIFVVNREAQQRILTAHIGAINGEIDYMINNSFSISTITADFRDETARLYITTTRDNFTNNDIQRFNKLIRLCLLYQLWEDEDFTVVMVEVTCNSNVIFSNGYNFADVP
jgi:hypothetical protein